MKPDFSTPYERFRWRLFKLAWRLNFASRMMIVTGCTLREGLRRADDAQMIKPNWYEAHPSRLADERMWIYKP